MMTRCLVILFPLTCSMPMAMGPGEAMLEHTVVFEREVRGRIHRFTCTKRCHTHVDIPLQVFYRAQRRNVPIDLDMLIEQVIAKELCDGKDKAQGPDR
jgi:hypothetical protein